MRLLTIPEVSDLLRVPPARAYELARQGVLPVVRLGRQVRVSEPALQRWIEDGGQVSGGWRQGSGGQPGQ
jgi:excisionase family DNA binding protein